MLRNRKEGKGITGAFQLHILNYLGPYLSWVAINIVFCIQFN